MKAIQILIKNITIKYTICISLKLLEIQSKSINRNHSFQGFHKILRIIIINIFKNLINLKSKINIKS